jgi:antitoxin component HigA of HigAB toxin-antitoxin module
MLYFLEKQVLLKSIKNNGQNGEALERIYMRVQKRINTGSNQSPELHNLFVLAKEYKNEHYDIRKPGRIAAIKFPYSQLSSAEFWFTVVVNLIISSREIKR